MDYSFIFLFVSFILAISVVYLTILMVRRWYVTFSPKEMAFFGLIMFAVGWTISSYLLGSALQILEGSAVVLVLFGLFLYRWIQRRSVNKRKSELGVR